MSQENAIKFFELFEENPNLFKEAEKYEKAESSYAALSKLAKEKGFECSEKEIKEIMEGMSNTISTGELDDSDLENVAGGGWIKNLWNKGKGYIQTLAKKADEAIDYLDRKFG